MSETAPAYTVTLAEPTPPPDPPVLCWCETHQIGWLSDGPHDRCPLCKQAEHLPFAEEPNFFIAINSPEKLLTKFNTCAMMGLSVGFTGNTPKESTGWTSK